MEVTSSEPIKRGRPRKHQSKDIKDQNRFIIQMNGVEESKKQKIFEIYEAVNSNLSGKSISLGEIAIEGLLKLNEKDIESIKLASLGRNEKILLEIEKYNKKHNKNLNVFDMAAKQLKIQ